MPCCNAHSLSQSTGIPRETIRRKIDALIARGWLEKVPGKGVRITPVCVTHFSHSFNVPTLTELLATARVITGILHAGKPERGSTG
jgi:DNA-binding GntR family transcriptional regulator